MTIKNMTKTRKTLLMTSLIAGLMLIPMNLPASEAVATVSSTVLDSVPDQTGSVVAFFGECVNAYGREKILNTTSVQVGTLSDQYEHDRDSCQRGVVTWDTSQIDQTISAAEISFEVLPTPLHTNTVNGVIHAVENDPRNVSPDELFRDIAYGTLYLSANPAFHQIGNQTVQMNQNFVDDINNSTDFIRIGIVDSDEGDITWDRTVLTNLRLELTYAPVTLYCGQPESYYNVIHGTENSDILIGTDNHDLIFGYGGHDLITGKGGHDCMYGGGGADLIKSGGGNDTIYGGSGSDYIKLGSGTNFAYGEAGVDILYSQSGSDTLDGGPGSPRDICTSNKAATTFVNCEVTDKP